MRGQVRTKDQGAYRYDGGLSTKLPPSAMDTRSEGGANLPSRNIDDTASQLTAMTVSLTPIS